MYRLTSRYSRDPVDDPEAEHRAKSQWPGETAPSKFDRRPLLSHIVCDRSGPSLQQVGTGRPPASPREFVEERGFHLGSAPPSGHLPHSTEDRGNRQIDPDPAPISCASRLRGGGLTSLGYGTGPPAPAGRPASRDAGAGAAVAIATRTRGRSLTPALSRLPRLTPFRHPIPRSRSVLGVRSRRAVAWRGRDTAIGEHGRTRPDRTQEPLGQSERQGYPSGLGVAVKDKARHGVKQKVVMPLSTCPRYAMSAVMKTLAPSKASMRNGALRYHHCLARRT